MTTQQAGGVRLQARHLSKHYGARAVLQNAQLDIAPGEFIAIVGRSGCGKSTLLRLVAGLEAASGGSLQVDGERISGLDPRTRIMFQEARLLPWKRVLDNVLLGLPEAARTRGEEVLDHVGLAERAREWPARLSGGQRQRVALARALVHQPQLLLLDEPLGALDALTRIEMHRLIEDLWQRHRFTALLVTHDVQEAVALADRVVLIEDGRIALDERIALPRPRVHGSVALADRVILIEDGRIALDQRIDLPRPRSQGDASFAAIEKRILDRVLQKPGVEEPEPERLLPAHALRWAV